jgi:hypothetical protein
MYSKALYWIVINVVSTILATIILHYTFQWLSGKKQQTI